MNGLDLTAIAGATAWDAGAVAAFVAVWMAYNIVIDGRFRQRRSINIRMIAVREAWMREFLRREQRMMDAALIGHSIRSATFFASTTLILLAALVGLLSSAETLHTPAASVSLLIEPCGRSLFEVRVLLLISIFVYAFFKFTWAIRQFNYFSAILGGAPQPGAKADPLLAERMALMLTNAFWQFNAGIRAYYFAVAALGWFVHPLAMIAGAVVVTGVLHYRQLHSPAAHGIADCLALMPSAKVPSSGPENGR